MSEAIPMRCGAAVWVLFVLTMPLHGAEPFRFSTNLGPITHTATLNRRTSLVPEWPSNKSLVNVGKQPIFGLKLISESSDPSTEIISLPEPVATEPEAAGEVRLFENGDATDDEPFIPPKPLNNVAIPIDGAAEQAEKGTEEKEVSIANTRSSIGWVMGDGNRLGIVELVSSPLPISAIEAGENSRFDLDFNYAVRWLNGPVVTDLPPQLFTLQINVGWAFHLSERLTVDTRISPGWYSDFDKSSAGFRLPWQVIAQYQTNDTWRWTAGVTDLDRDDIQALPVVGITYAPPDSDVLLDLVFPWPKAALRLTHGEARQHWLFIAGELGGGSFGITRAAGFRDVATLRDLRLLFGIETIEKKRHASRLEAGWVFDRAVEYRSHIGDYRPSDTAIIRWSSDF